MYKLGQSVIVTEQNKKTKEEKHQVGVIIKQRKIKRQLVYDVLLETRSVNIILNTSRSNKTFINHTLTEKLCDSGDIIATIPYHSLVEKDLLPFIDYS